MSPRRQMGDLIVAIGVVSLIPALAGLGATLLRPLTDAVDPARCFARASVHHVLQLGLTVLLLRTRSVAPLSEWGFNLRERLLSVKIFAWFCLLYLVPVFFVNLLPSLRSNVPPAFGYPLTGKNIAGTLGFQFLLSGTCEEPLFRGYVMTFLGRSWRGEFRLGRVVLPIAGLWATALFLLAHVSIRLAPFSIKASALQEAWALGLGLYYAAAFARTGSLLAPVLSHGYANGVIFLLLYAMAFAMR